MSFEDPVATLRHPKATAGDELPLPRVALGAVNRDGSFHYAKSFEDGLDDATGTDAVHYIASATKLVTTIAVMQCVERGLLDLDADVAKVLPEWENPQVLTGFTEDDQPIFRPSTKPITLRHFLTHSSGLAYVYMEPLLTRYAQLPIAEPRNPNTLKDKFYPFLVAEPGDRWIYSPGVDWAGRMVEQVTSQKLGEYMKDNIFDVVSVRDATFHLKDREDMRARSAKAWERNDREIHVADKKPWADPVEDDLGGGGLYTTATELLKIYQGILNGKLLREETVKSMFEPQLKTTVGLDNQPDHSTSYRNAIFNAIPHDMPVNFGLGGLMNLAASGMPNCYWWIDLKKGVAGVYLSQLTLTGRYASLLEAKGDHLD
ncbi:beta-lactamase/transpeptidase-like protein [Plectosphaerella plurivora]|uniref:Beta-lactamase/transpeptidase-like protein n=1 Tax=Plectosphaerella plurivora TaxID=936078 RepID=A0A9P9AB49_9PEZI|nr:beta-lactamase/transpeptidase-like protein [Plectosphaerella plurivora]